MSVRKWFIFGHRNDATVRKGVIHRGDRFTVERGDRSPEMLETAREDGIENENKLKSACYFLQGYLGSTFYF